MTPATASIDCTGLVLDPFGPGARLDEAALRAAVQGHFNKVSQTSDFHDESPGLPQPQIRLEGLADTLAILGHRYDSWTARGAAEDLVSQVAAALDAGGAGRSPRLSVDCTPLSRSRPGMAVMLWQRLRGATPFPYALAHGMDPPAAAQAAMTATLRPWLAGSAAGSCDRSYGAV